MKNNWGQMDDSYPTPGELRTWIPRCGRKGTFMVISFEGFRVDVVMDDGHREGIFRPYLMNNSYALSQD